MVTTEIQLLSSEEAPSSAVPILQPNLKTSSLPTLTRSQLIEAVVMIMEDIIQGQGKIYAKESEIANKTIFHASVLPSISLSDYITRFFHYAKCQDEVLVFTLIYLDRIGEITGNFSLDSFNVHKLLLINMTAACKFWEDQVFTNTYYANVGGIPVAEFNKLEEDYLVNWLQFKLNVQNETYQAYLADVAKYYQDKVSSKR